MAGPLAKTIAKLQRLRETLRPDAFYQSHRTRWQERAHRIAVAILRNSRPADADATQWAARVEAEAARISSALFLDEDSVGVIISLGLNPAGVAIDSPQSYNIAGLSVSEIERWVAAGREKENPDDPGKNIDQVQDVDKSGRPKTDLQIAWRIIWAIKLQKPGVPGLIAAIQKFLGAENAEAASGLYGEILNAWLEQLIPEIHADFRHWFRHTVATAMK